MKLVTTITPEPEVGDRVYHTQYTSFIVTITSIKFEVQTGLGGNKYKELIIRTNSPDSGGCNKRLRRYNLTWDEYRNMWSANG